MAEKGDMNHHKALQEDVAALYERATSTLLKENVLLHFSYADFEEVIGCLLIYEKVKYRVSFVIFFASLEIEKTRLLKYTKSFWKLRQQVLILRWYTYNT